MVEIGIDKIFYYIPHRPPTLLISKVEVYSFKSGRGFHSLNTTLPIFRLMEGVFQTAGVIRNYSSGYIPSSELRLLSMINDINLFCDISIIPGDYSFQVDFVKISKKFDQFKGTIFSGDIVLLTCNAYCGGF